MTKPTTKLDSPAATPGTPVSFEVALEEVESIIRRIESGEIGLEESITQYERGVGLVRQCRETLDKVEQRVIDVTAQMQAQTQGQTHTAQASLGPSAEKTSTRRPATDTPF